MSRQDFLRLKLNTASSGGLKGVKEFCLFRLIYYTYVLPHLFSKARSETGKGRKLKLPVVYHVLDLETLHHFLASTQLGVSVDDT